MDSGRLLEENARDLQISGPVISQQEVRIALQAQAGLAAIEMNLKFHVEKSRLFETWHGHEMKTICCRNI